MNFFSNIFHKFLVIYKSYALLLWNAKVTLISQLVGPGDTLVTINHEKQPLSLQKLIFVVPKCSTFN